MGDDDKFSVDNPPPYGSTEYYKWKEWVELTKEAAVRRKVRLIRNCLILYAIIGLLSASYDWAHVTRDTVGWKNQSDINMYFLVGIPLSNAFWPLKISVRLMSLLP